VGKGECTIPDVAERDASERGRGIRNRKRQIEGWIEKGSARGCCVVGWLGREDMSAPASAREQVKCEEPSERASKRRDSERERKRERKKEQESERKRK
jgi:hypothetical protein